MAHTEFYLLSGNADVNVQKDVFIIDDPSQGAVLHRLQSKAKVRT